MALERSPFVNNPFRILGIFASATLPEISAARECAVETSPKKNVVLLPWLRPSDDQKRQHFISVLDDVVQRMWSRLGWFHCNDQVDAEALELLRSGRVADAGLVWKNALETGKNKNSYAFNMYILYASRAYEAPLGPDLLRSDLQNAFQYWARVSGSTQGLFMPILLDGEDNTALAEQDKEAMNRRATAMVRQWNNALLHYALRCLPELGGFGRARFLNFPGSSSYWGGEGIDNSLMLRNIAIRIATDKAMECATRGDWPATEKALEEAAQLYEGEVDDELRDFARMVRIKVLQKDLTPLKAHLRVVGNFWLGTALINTGSADRLSRTYVGDFVFRIFRIPVWFFGRFRVFEDHKNEIKFIGRYQLGWRILGFNAIILLISMLFFAYMVSMDFSFIEGAGRFDARKFDNGVITISLDEILEQKKTHEGCVQMRLKAQASLKKLSRRRDELRGDILPTLRKHVAKPPSGMDEAGVAQLKESLQTAQNELTRVETGIKDTHAFIKYTKQLESHM